MRKTLAILLFLVMVISILPTLSGVAYAADESDLINDQIPEVSEEPPEKDQGGLFERILAGIVSIPANIIEGVLEWWGSFKSLDELVFFQGYTDEQKRNLPWEGNEPEYVRLWFETLTIVTAPFLVLVIAGCAFKLFYAATNPAARSEAMESFQRGLCAVAIVVFMPVMVSTLMWICTVLVDAISGGFDHVASIADISRSTSDWGAADLAGRKIVTGSILGTALVRMFLMGIFAYLNVIYIVRKIALTVFYCFTPIAAMIYVVNKRSVAMPVLIGEIASNAFMPVAHALVLCTILLFCDVKEMGNGSWITILVSFYTLIPLSEVLRNSLQSVLMQWAGLNESSVASSAFGAAMGLGGVMSLARVGGSLLGSKTPLSNEKISSAGGGRTRFLRTRPIGFQLPRHNSSPPPGGPSQGPGGFAPQVGGFVSPIYSGAPSSGASSTPNTSTPNIWSKFGSTAENIRSSPKVATALKIGSVVGKAASLAVGGLAALTLPAIPGGGRFVKPVMGLTKGAFGLAAGGAYLAGDYMARSTGKRIGLAAQSGSQLAQKTVQAGKAVQSTGQSVMQKIGFGGEQQAPAPQAQIRQKQQIGFNPQVAKYPGSSPKLK